MEIDALFRELVASSEVTHADELIQQVPAQASAAQTQQVQKRQSQPKQLAQPKQPAQAQASKQIVQKAQMRPTPQSQQQTQQQPQPQAGQPEASTPPQVAVRPTAASTTKNVVVVTAPAHPNSNVDKAKRFKQLVKEVNSILDGAMLKLKKDKKLFHRAATDGRSKKSTVTNKAASAKQDAKGDATRIEAIETHMQLAVKDNAKVFIKFATKFRKSAKRAFWKSYNTADTRQSKLNDLYHEITTHVAHAVRAMRSHGHKLNSKYVQTIKAFYKAKYSCVANKKDKKKQAACAKVTQEKKAKTKSAHKALLNFQKNMQTAHHHGRKLRKRLKHALKKLHFVFKKARHTFRRISNSFHVGYRVHYEAMVAVSKRALRVEAKKRAKKVAAKKEKVDRKSNNKKKIAKKHSAATESESKHARRSDKVALLPKQGKATVAHISKDAVHSAEMKAVNAVAKAANAILKKTKKHKKAKAHTKIRMHAAEMMETKHKMMEDNHHTPQYHSRKTAQKRRAERKAEKKALTIVKKAILQVRKQQDDGGLEDVLAQATDKIVPETL